MKFYKRLIKVLFFFKTLGSSKYCLPTNVYLKLKFGVMTILHLWEDNIFFFMTFFPYFKSYQSL